MSDEQTEKREKEELIAEYRNHPHETWGCDRCRLQTIHIKTIDEDNDVIKWECSICHFTVEKKIVEKNNLIAVRKRHHESYTKENT